MSGIKMGGEYAAYAPYPAYAAGVRWRGAESWLTAPNAAAMLISSTTYGVVVAVAQLVRAPDCGSGGWGFETPQPPLLGS